MDTAQLLQEIETLKKEIEFVNIQLKSIEKSFMFLYNIKEMQAGVGDLSFRMDRNGLWLGKKLWADVSTGTPQGTGIGMDGTFYGKDGITGTITIPSGGGSFNVKNGLVTS